MKLCCALLWILLIHGQALALTIATGSSEGTYYKIAQDIKQIAEKDGIPVEIIQTGGSFDNINLLGAGKVDLAIMQLDVLRFVTEIMLKETGLNVLREAKVALNLYLEEIHIITKNPDIRTVQHLQGKRVAIGPEKSGSALTSEVLLAGFGVKIEPVFDAPEGAVKKLSQGEIDALIFIGGAPVPAFQKLDKSFHFVALPADSGLEQIYPKKKIAKSVYPWTDEVDTHAVPSVIMTRNRAENDYVSAVQRLVLLILTQKEHLDATGHPKWKDSFVRSTQESIGYRPATEVIHLYNNLDSMGYRIMKK
ncbi:MAG: TAXI family TRAP transporter solute-binding subunit [Candidatus Binatia bacterium]